MDSFTFPESFNALDPGYGLVGVDGAVVPLRDAALWQVDLSLKPDLHHVGGLGEGHCHCPRGAACEQPCPDSYICDLKIHKNSSYSLILQVSSTRARTDDSRDAL